MARTILGDPDRYVEKYWQKYAAQGWYLAGDSARKDEDGYYWIIGRIDDVIKVSGYRLGSAEIESALVSHPMVNRSRCYCPARRSAGEYYSHHGILRNGDCGQAPLF